MSKSRKNGSPRSVTGIVTFLLCCFSIQNPKEERLRVKHVEKDDKMNISLNAISFHEEFNEPDDAPKLKEDYPEYLNPFANDTDGNFIIRNQGMRKRFTINDYPEHFNPFSDDDDDD